MIKAFNKDSDRIIAFKGDREPVKVYQGANLVENVSYTKKTLTNGENGNIYDTPYNKSLMDFYIKGLTSPNYKDREMPIPYGDGFTTSVGALWSITPLLSIGLNVPEGTACGVEISPTNVSDANVNIAVGYTPEDFQNDTNLQYAWTDFNTQASANIVYVDKPFYIGVKNGYFDVCNVKIYCYDYESAGDEGIVVGVQDYNILDLSVATVSQRADEVEFTIDKDKGELTVNGTNVTTSTNAEFAFTTRNTRSKLTKGEYRFSLRVDGGTYNNLITSPLTIYYTDGTYFDSNVNVNNTIRVNITKEINYMVWKVRVRPGGSANNAIFRPMVVPLELYSADAGYVPCKPPEYIEIPSEVTVNGETVKLRLGYDIVSGVPYDALRINGVEKKVLYYSIGDFDTSKPPDEQVFDLKEYDLTSTDLGRQLLTLSQKMIHGKHRIVASSNNNVPIFTDLTYAIWGGTNEI